MFLDFKLNVFYHTTIQSKNELIRKKEEKKTLIYAAVNFFMSCNFCVSFVFGYGNGITLMKLNQKKNKNYLR